ncbi:hypothetical protein BMI79_12485 [Serratia oryzae]|uniref:Uncharacterized protein n=1 Tax=Serratia oryzae TaxID=2034155 RepID=A0A1S8CKK4_9GAMM|nr:hypothetical protein BMI79_12485 [Serratia oryzae]
MINEKNFLNRNEVVKKLTNWRLIDSLLPSATQVSLFNHVIIGYHPAASRIQQGLALAYPFAIMCYKPLT